MKFKKWLENMDAAAAHEWGYVLDSFRERFPSYPKQALMELSAWLRRKYMEVRNQLYDLHDHEGGDEADDDGNDVYVPSDHDNRINAAIEFFDMNYNFPSALATEIKGALKGGNRWSHIHSMRNGVNDTQMNPQARQIVNDFSSHMEELWKGIASVGQENPGWETRV